MSEYLSVSNGESFNIFHISAVLQMSCLRGINLVAVCGKDEREECLQGETPIREFSRAEYNGH